MSNDLVEPPNWTLSWQVFQENERNIPVIPEFRAIVRPFGS